MVGTATMLHRFLLLSYGLVSVSAFSGNKAILVTGANKGQGFALCDRILSEYDDTHIFLCSRDVNRGNEASSRLLSRFPGRVVTVQLDVSDKTSIEEAFNQVKKNLDDKNQLLYGLVSNAGVLWNYPLSELVDVCTIGPKNIMDAFLPLIEPNGGRVIVVSSGLGPLMHTFSSKENTEKLQIGNWETIQPMIEECLDVAAKNNGGSPKDFENIGFPGGPFADTAPEFHMYGLAKMFADSYMKSLARSNPNLAINSCDPGLVYTDLIDRIPRYADKPIEDTGAKTPAEGVEVCMRLLFGNDETKKNGLFYAVNKSGKLVSSDIDIRPDV